MTDEIPCNELWRRFEAHGGSLVYKRDQSEIVLMTPIRSFCCRTTKKHEEVCVVEKRKIKPVSEVKERGVTKWAYYHGEVGGGDSRTTVP
jgi:hypothetical protein